MFHTNDAYQCIAPLIAPPLKGASDKGIPGYRPILNFTLAI